MAESDRSTRATSIVPKDRLPKPLWWLFGCWLALGLGCSVSVNGPIVELPPQLKHTWSYDVANTDESIVAIVELAEDPYIRALVRRAMANNLELRQTALRLEESLALQGVSRARRMPRVDASMSAQRDGGAAAPNWADDETRQFFSQTGASAGFQLSWELDVWGRLADEHRAAAYENVALESDLQSARNSLVARTIQTALDRVYRARTLEIELRRAESLDASIEVIRRRFRFGLGALVDWDAAESSRASVQATIAQRREEVARADRLLSVLLGDYSLTPVELSDRLPSVSRPLAEFPAEVLARRPDVGAALALVTGQTIRTRAAHRALLPRFQISANGTATGGSLGRLLRGDPVWTLLGGLTAPLFDGGSLRAQAKAADFAEERAYVAYQQTLLTAVAEVEDALDVESSLSKQLVHLEHAAERARLSLETFEERYQNGLADIVDLLVTQRAAFDAEQRLLDATYGLLFNRIELGLALGLDAT